MTDQNLTEIICIVDRSGSMAMIADDAIGGFNQFLEDQKKVDVDKCNLTYVQFDSEYEVIHECKPIQDVPALTNETFQPRGSTALLDAVGKTIADAGNRFSALSEEKRPGAVVVVILTDGQENSSCEFTREQVKDMIQTQTDVFSWEFIFLGANQDSFTEGSMLGIGAKNIGNFGFSSAGVKSVYSNVSQTIANYRGTKNTNDLVVQDENN